eukprot:3563580-Prymnesium_polylepis.1
MLQRARATSAQHARARLSAPQRATAHRIAAARHVATARIRSGMARHGPGVSDHSTHTQWRGASRHGAARRGTAWHGGGAAWRVPRRVPCAVWRVACGVRRVWWAACSEQPRVNDRACPGNTAHLTTRGSFSRFGARCPFPPLTRTFSPVAFSPGRLARARSPFDACALAV